MRFVVVVLMLVLCMTQAKEEVVKEISDIVEGMLSGIFKGSFPIKDCIKDSKKLIKDFESAANDWNQGITPSNVAEGIQEIGKAFKELPSALKNCKECANVVGKLKKMFTIFANPFKTVTQVGKNILWNHKDITKNLKGAVKTWNERDFFQFGQHVGMMISQLVGDARDIVEVDNLQMTAKEGAQFFAGFFEKLFAKTDDLTPCITQAEELEAIVMDIHTQFQAGLAWKQLVAVGEDFRQLFNLIPEEFATCKAVPGEILDELKFWGNEFTHPVTFAETVVKAMWNDHKQLTADVATFTKSVIKKEYFKAGESFGDFLAIVLGHPSNSPLASE